MRVCFTFGFAAALAASLPAFGSAVPRSNFHHLHHLRRHSMVRHHLATQTGELHVQIPQLERIHIVPPLRGSYASLVRQNQKSEAEGLARIEDDAQLTGLESSRDLVPLPASAALHVNLGLPGDRRYCRPWTARF